MLSSHAADMHSVESAFAVLNLTAETQRNCYCQHLSKSEQAASIAKRLKAQHSRQTQCHNHNSKGNSRKLISYMVPSTLAAPGVAQHAKHGSGGFELT